jgi:multidrug transporter EmrE-like cation transporter
MVRWHGYVYILATILLTVFGQLTLKWRIRSFGPMPDQFIGKFSYFSGLLLDPVILSGFAAAFLASITWMAAMTRFELSYAYPFMSLNFVLVLLLSTTLFGEPVTAAKLAGCALIVVGTFVAARG